MYETGSLVEDLGKRFTSQWARVAVLAELYVLQLLAQLGSGHQIESWRGGVNFGLEEAQDDVAAGLGHGSGGEIADQAAVAGFGLVGDNGIDHQVGLLFGLAGGGTAETGKEVGSDTSGDEGLQQESSSDSNGGTGWGHEQGGGGRAGSEGGEAEGGAAADGGGSEGSQDGADAVHSAAQDGQTEK